MNLLILWISKQLKPGSSDKVKPLLHFVSHFMALQSSSGINVMLPRVDQYNHYNPFSEPLTGIEKCSFELNLSHILLLWKFY